MDFKQARYADMHFVYGFCDGNSLAVVREYQNRYPDRKQPYRRVLERVHRNLTETGTLKTHALAGRERRNVRGEDDVLDILHDKPPTSTRHISYATGRLSQRAAWRSN
jgi:hypothetical protein